MMKKSVPAHGDELLAPYPFSAPFVVSRCSDTCPGLRGIKREARQQIQNEVSVLCPFFVHRHESSPTGLACAARAAKKAEACAHIRTLDSLLPCTAFAVEQTAKIRALEKESAALAAKIRDSETLNEKKLAQLGRSGLGCGVAV